MNPLFLDASALVKRYITETGSNWMNRLLNPTANHLVTIAEITQVEVAAALAARHRAPVGISRQMRDGAVNLLAKHCQQEYQLMALTPVILDHAVYLTQNHRLRGYDAVQLATAIAANQIFIGAGFTSLTFITADSDLLKAAQAEGLHTDNPNLYP